MEALVSREKKKVKGNNLKEKSEEEAQPRTETKEEEPAKNSVMKRENFSSSERSSIKCSSNFQ